ncbi:MAG TPA: hypothetical protein IAC12_00190 [Candidatus Aphodovivens avistercoris]|nr:hypothetical protein [Candidatus Aphodovivens avistercoris]
MQTSRTKTIKGLNIATIVLSALGIFGMLVCLLFLALGGAAVSSPGFQDAVNSSITIDPESARELEAAGLTSNDVYGLMGFVLAIGGAYVVWALICCIVSLVAGIIGLRNCTEKEKLGKAFGWAIAGAALSFLYGNIVTTVLLVISAVCLSKDRKEATAIPYGQPAAYTQTAGQAGYYGAPQQPYGAQPQPGYAAQPYAAGAAQPQPGYGAQPYGSQLPQSQQPIQTAAQPVQQTQTVDATLTAQPVQPSDNGNADEPKQQ